MFVFIKSCGPAVLHTQHQKKQNAWPVFFSWQGSGDPSPVLSKLQARLYLLMVPLAWGTYNPVLRFLYTAHHAPGPAELSFTRTLLSLPTWTYTKGKDELYVNLFVGSTVTVDNLAGTSVKLVQTTDYPWSGKVALTVNPVAAKQFALKIRVPNRQVSSLYTSTPTVGGLTSLAINGQPLKPTIANGYAVLARTWKAGDKVEWEVPMKVQRVTGSNKIAATKGRVALRYGPLIYNVENADQRDLNQPLSNAPLTTEWRGDLLEGVMVIKGTWADGSPMVAVPNYARLNRPMQVPATTEAAPAVDYAGGAAARANTPRTNPPARPGASMVWIKE